MRSFDAADVAMFQHGQDSLSGAAERRCDLAAPAHFLACVHGKVYPVGGGTSPADGPADPCVRVVEVRCDLDEIKHRILDAGTWRQHCRMPGPQDGVRPVNDNALDLRLCGVPRHRNRDRDGKAWLVDETVPLGCRLVTENRAWPGAQQGT